eukprot:2104914-Pyramimonas_sp.AAC.1
MLRFHYRRMGWEWDGGVRMQSPRQQGRSGSWRREDEMQARPPRTLGGGSLGGCNKTPAQGIAVRHKCGLRDQLC